MDKYCICLIRNKLYFIDFYMNIIFNLKLLYTFLKWILKRNRLCKNEPKLRKAMVGRYQTYEIKWIEENNNEHSLYTI